MKQLLLKFLKWAVYRLELNDRLANHSGVYSNRYVARRLTNGKWVLWDKYNNGALWIDGSSSLRWRPEEYGFYNCVGTRAEVHALAQNVAFQLADESEPN